MRDTSTYWFVGIIVALALLAIAYLVFSANFSVLHDDTDPPGGRSGRAPLTDAKTGCQYLTTGHGGLTPRIDAAGRPICAKD